MAIKRLRLLKTDAPFCAVFALKSARMAFLYNRTGALTAICALISAYKVFINAIIYLYTD